MNENYRYKNKVGLKYEYIQPLMNNNWTNESKKYM